MGVPHTAPAATAHPFRPDFPAEPGYRPHCLDCGQEKPVHVPAPRTPTRQHNPKEQQP